MGPLGDALTIGCMCLIAIPVDDRWHGYLFVLLAAAVIFTSAYGSLPHVLLRTTAMVAIEVGEGLADPASLTIAVVFAVGLVIVACLMSGMVNSVALYEATSRREQVLAATGLDLVAASDLTGDSRRGRRERAGSVRNPQGRPRQPGDGRRAGQPAAALHGARRGRGRRRRAEGRGHRGGGDRPGRPGAGRPAPAALGRDTARPARATGSHPVSDNRARSATARCC